MKTISAKEAKNAFGSFLDSAQWEPIMITKRDRPIGIFFSMQDIEALIQVSEAFKKIIHAGIISGIADAETARVTESSQEHTNELKTKLRARLTSGESLFLRKLVLRTSCPNKRQNLNATANACGCPSRPATLVPYPTRGMQHRCAMTRRDVVKPCIFTPQTALRENTQHYRFWGLKIFTPLTLRFQDFQRQ